MNAMTPIPEGTVIYIGKEEEDNPESNITAYLVPPSEDGDDQEWIVLGWSQIGQDLSQFVWMVKSMATFHNLEVQNESGVEG